MPSANQIKRRCAGHIPISFVNLTYRFLCVILGNMSETNPKEKDPKEYELAVLVRDEKDLAAVSAFVRESGAN